MRCARNRQLLLRRAIEVDCPQMLRTGDYTLSTVRDAGLHSRRREWLWANKRLMLTGAGVRNGS